MTEPAAASPENDAPKDTLRVLLVDEQPGDLQAVVEALADSVNAEVLASTTAEAAWDSVQSLGELDFFIAGIPSENGNSVFELRDKLRERFGDSLMGAFCSRKDMSAYYDRVQGERLFYKPIDDDFLRKWVAEITGHGAQSDVRIQDTEAINPGELAAAQERAKAEGKPTPVSASDLPDGELAVDTALGDYKLLRLIQGDEDIAMYEAEQTSINRRVALKTLFRRHRKDPGWVGAFVGEARARALVNHPDISLVYEAAQDYGVNYYTLELIEAPSLLTLAKESALLDDVVVRRLLRSCADAIAYLRANRMRHRTVGPESIFLMPEGQPRIANPVKGGDPADNASESDQMALLASGIQPFVKIGKSDPGLVEVVERMSDATAANHIGSARGLQEALEKLDAEDSGYYYETPEDAEKRSNKTAVVVGGLIGAVIVAAAIIAVLLTDSGPVAKDFDYMVRIPESSFIYQEKELIELPTFWIDEFEVTIGQYAKFLEALEAEPALLAEVAHPDQPESKTGHAPPDWANYYPLAIAGKKYGGSPIDMNCPVMQTDWWDAHAYATWKGHRLPTEQEWEKAARGREGNLFPWGNEPNLSAFNSGVSEADGGDAFKYWSPVDAIEGDSSRYSVRGLAGNVSEWTASWDTHPDFPDRTVPIRRGASYATTEGFELTNRRPAESAGEAKLITGFRTVRDTPEIER